MTNGMDSYTSKLEAPVEKQIRTETIGGFWKRRYGHLRLRFVDWNCIGYMALIAVLLPMFHHHVPNWPLDVLIHVALIWGALEVIRSGELHPANRVLWTMRTFYPVVFLAYGWSELNHLVLMIFGSFWANDLVVGIDKLVFGVHPTVWVQQLYSPVLDELMNVFNLGYYLFMPMVLLPLFLRGKREETLAAFGIATLAYFVNFVLFFFFPTLSPRVVPGLAEAHTVDFTGYVAASIIRTLQANGSVFGAAFPSSHVTAAVAWCLAALRYNRKMGYLLIAMAVGMAISTVYLRYHHAVDAIAGTLLGVACYYVALSVLKKRGEDPHGSVAH